MLEHTTTLRYMRNLENREKLMPSRKFVSGCLFTKIHGERRRQKEIYKIPTFIAESIDGKREKSGFSYFRLSTAFIL